LGVSAHFIVLQISPQIKALFEAGVIHDCNRRISLEWSPVSGACAFTAIIP